MSVYRILEKMEAYVRDGTWLPAGYRILSEERLVELIEKLRATLPEEVGRAKIITKDHERIMRAAQDKAEAIVSEASSKHEELVDQNEIVTRARRTAETVLRETEERARKIRDGADHYAAGVLADLESRLGAALGSVRKGRETLARRPESPAAQPLADAAAKSKREAFDHQTPDETAGLETVREGTTRA